MTPTRRALPLRVVFTAIGLASLAFVAAVTLQVVVVLRPAAADLQGLTSDLLGDHATIAANLSNLRETRGAIARYAPPMLPGSSPPVSLDVLRDSVRGLLDGSIVVRASIERADIPLEMRLLLAQALEQEAQFAVRLLETVRAVELRRPDEAFESLRASGVHSDSASQLLSSAQRVALGALLVGQDRMLARLTRLESSTHWFAVTGLGLFAFLAWLISTRFYQPVRAMERAVRRVAEGDLTAEAPVRRGDELGRLARHLNAMTQVLRDREHEESRRRESLTERFGRILDESANQIFVFDARSLALLQANRGARVAIGYAREELASLTLPALIEGIPEERIGATLDALRDGQQPRVFLAAWLRRKDGSRRATELTLQHASEGESAVFIAVAEDAGVRQRVRELDDRLRAFTLAEQHTLTSGDLEGALRPLTQMAAGALEATRCGVWRVVDGELELVVAYDARRGVHEATGGDPDADPTAAPLQLPVRSRGRIVAMVVVEHAGEQRIWTPEERTFGGAVADLVARALDATERRSLEHALQRAQRMDSIGQLAGGVAHDFNNILTAILGNLEACRADLPPGAPMDAALAEAEQAALRAAELTRQLLTFARHQVVESRVVDVNEQLRGAEPMLRRLLGSRNTLVTDFERDLQHVRLGTGQIEQLVVNLTVNARDAMPMGGAVTLSTRNVALDITTTDSAAGLDDGDYVELVVSDTGVGMDKSTVDRAFEPFFTTKRLGEGTGLGLAVCYGVVHNAGGSIGVSSTPGRGTAFRILLPAVRERLAPPPPARRAPVPGGSEVVLVAEDEPSIRALIVRMLGGRGYHVIAAADGAEAVALATARDGPIDLLITDVVMPNLGGVDAARRLRAQRPGLAVLFISGYTATAAILEGDLADAAFLAKPFTPDELGRRVRQLLDARDAVGERVATE